MANYVLSWREDEKLLECAYACEHVQHLYLPRLGPDSN